jgi:predicted phage terminase large subunit-like protein
MLSDSTFRSFLAVASQLGVVNMTEVKKSAPPTVKLRTGAEVLFRSGDDPSHLYGPNLSGIWLDEASLMPREVYDVGIGRLREAGEQGFLTATFTPKGLSHWSHEVFNTGKPNTAIFFCRTSDNPFLPAEFADNVRGQYTSRLALQELEGKFIDAEGGLFNRQWFKLAEAAPDKLLCCCRAWDLASTPKDERKAATDPDWTVGALLGRADNGDSYVLDITRLRGSPDRVETVIRNTAEQDGRNVAVWLEQEPGSAGVTVVDHYARHVLNGYDFHAERSTGPKATRAMPLAAAAERGLVKLVRSHWNGALLDELSAFPYADHDDQVDAAALAFNKLGSKRRFWMWIDGSRVGHEREPAAPQDPNTRRKLVDAGCGLKHSPVN